MSQKNSEIFSKVILPLDSIASEKIIGSAGSINSANDIESKEIIGSAGSINSANDIESEEIIGSAGSINSANDIELEKIIGSDFLNLEYSPYLEYNPNLEYSIDSKYSELGSYSIESENLIFQEDSIAPAYSIESENLIFQEDSIAPAYSIDSKYSIAPQEIGVDSLTGMAGNWWWWWPWPGTNNGSKGNALKDARLNISKNHLVLPWPYSDSNLMSVTATVKVELSGSQMNFVNNGGSLVLQSSLWGIDNTIFDRRDDNLLYFPDQKITQSGTYTFNTLVASSVLDEDRVWYDHRDEIQASISLRNYSSASPLNLRTTTNIWYQHF
jgi:hypothetical protein